MGLRDDDQQIFEDRALLDWARSAPQAPGSYDYPASEEAMAAYDYDRRKWMEQKPYVRSSYDDEWATRSVGGYSGSSPQVKKKPAKKKPAKKTATKKRAKKRNVRN